MTKTKKKINLPNIGAEAAAAGAVLANGMAVGVACPIGVAMSSQKR